MVINCSSALKSSKLELLSEFCLQHSPRLYKQMTMLVVLSLKRMIPPSLNSYWARWHLLHYTNFDFFLRTYVCLFYLVELFQGLSQYKNKQINQTQQTLILVLVNGASVWVGVCFNCPIHQGHNQLTIRVITGGGQLEWTQALREVRKCPDNDQLAISVKVIQYFNRLRCTYRISGLTTDANAGKCTGRRWVGKLAS